MSSSSVCRRDATKKSPARPGSTEREIGCDGFRFPASRAYFVVKVTSDDVVDGRLVPYMLIHAMEAGHVDNVAAAVAVGDTPLDLQAANNGGLGGAVGVW